jgi:hypothetical protein
VDVAIQNGWAVAFPKWKRGIKDASDASKKYGKLLTVHSILESATSNKTKIKLQWDISASERDKGKQNVRR